MDDALGYAGRRVVVTGAASGIGAATARVLVDVGAEVHAIGTQRRSLSGLASFTEADERDVAQFDAALDRIGSVVNALFDCAGTLEPARVVDGVVPLMIDGAAIATLAPDADGFVRERAAELAKAGVRINAVHAGDDADAVAWALVLCNSPRASYVTGSVLTGVDTQRPARQR